MKPRANLTLTALLVTASFLAAAPALSQSEGSVEDLEALGRDTYMNEFGEVWGPGSVYVQRVPDPSPFHINRPFGKASDPDWYQEGHRWVALASSRRAQLNKKGIQEIVLDIPGQGLDAEVRALLTVTRGKKTVKALIPVTDPIYLGFVRRNQQHRVSIEVPGFKRFEFETNGREDHTWRVQLPE